MKKESLSKCVWPMVAFVFMLLGTCHETQAQDWSIKQLKNSQHPILETTGKRFDFRDDVLGHVVAELETDFVDDQLHLNISAQSARISGYRSYRHVAGSNRMTARVLRRMVDGVSRIELRDQTGRLIPATLKATEQKLPERRLNPDGSMDYLAMTQQDFVVQLEVVSEVLSQGSYRIDLFLESRLRLQIKFRVNEKFQAVSFHSAVHFVSQPQSQTQQAEKPRKKLDRPADWEQRDFEGKYFLLSQAIKRDENELPSWVDFLFEQKEYLLLEQIVLTQPGGFDCNRIGSRLADVSAPNWPRLVYWAKTYGREHTNISPSTVIENHGDAYYSWCLQNQIEVSAKVKFEKNDVSQYWAKLDSEKVFAALEPPEKVSKFSGKQAVKGEFYLQQFERAALTVVNWQRIYRQRGYALFQLLKHSNDDLRKQVLLAYTHLEPSSVPYRDLFEVANDKSEADSIREIAALAASYGSTNKIMAQLDAIATQVDHPGWKPAVSRLGDIGNGYDLKILRAQKPSGEELQKILQRSIKLIDDRETEILKIWRANEHENGSNFTNVRANDAAVKIRRLVDARMQKEVSTEALQKWTVEYFKTVADPSVVTKICNRLTNHQAKDAYTDQFDACVNEVLEAINRTAK